MSHLFTRLRGLISPKAPAAMPEPAAAPNMSALEEEAKIKGPNDQARHQTKVLRKMANGSRGGSGGSAPANPFQ